MKRDRQETFEPMVNTKAQLEEVAEVLVKYQRANHRLPCPAPLNQLPDSINFGVEGINCHLGGAIAGISRIDLGGGVFARAGTLPLRTLGLESGFGGDKWNNRLSYIVLERLTDPFQFTTALGGLRLQDSSGTAMTTLGAYALISHGRDGKGAVPMKGTSARSCTLKPGRDQENCDADGVFVTTMFTPTEGTDYFDDFIIVREKDAQANGMNRPCQPPTPATPVTFGSGCAGPYVNAVHGDSQTINNTVPEHTGSANVTCNNGSFVINSQSCAYTPSCTAAAQGWVGAVSGCSASRPLLAHGQSTNLTNTVGGRTGSVTVTCTAGVISTNSATCTGNSCPLPWGGSLAHGGSIGAFQTSSVPCGNTCNSETRSCSFGSLSGSFTNQSCSAVTCLNCTAPWGATVPHTSSVTAFAASSVPCGSSCSSQTRTCTNGSLSGTFTAQSCSAVPCAACNLPWGGTVGHGGAVTAYAAWSVGCGGSCAAQTRWCNNGSLSGSYGAASCSVAACASCALPWGGWVGHGGAVTAFAAGSVPCGSSCSAQTRVCSNGSLSGWHTAPSCSVGACGPFWVALNQMCLRFGVSGGGGCTTNGYPANPTPGSSCSHPGWQCRGWIPQSCTGCDPNNPLFANCRIAQLYRCQ
jgi:hypothetical protein